MWKLEPGAENVLQHKMTITRDIKHYKDIKCFICGHISDSPSSFNKHVAGHGSSISKSKITFSCDFCEKCFKQEFELHHHTNNLHKEQPKDKKCDLCQKEFSQKAFLQNHKYQNHKSVLQEKFKCGLCNHIFYKAEFLKMHLENLHGQYQKPVKSYHQCDFCIKCFASETQVKEHISKVHQQYICKVCFKVFKEFPEVEAHIKSEHELNDLTAIAEQRWAMILPKDKVVIKSTENAQCGLCLKLIGLQSIPYHLKTMHEKIEIKCDYCEMSFNRQNELIIHTSRFHKDEKVLECNFCEKTFIQKSILDSHLKKFHGGKTLEENQAQKKPATFFMCTFCDDTFDAMDKLQNHTNENHKDLKNSVKPIESPPPGKNKPSVHVYKPEKKESEIVISLNDPLTTNQKANQTKNVQLSMTNALPSTIQEEDSTKEIENPNAIKIFPVQDILKSKGSEVPIRRGTYEKCPICSKLFKNLQDLNYHAKRIHGLNHDMQKIHKCNICCKFFEDFNIFKSHIPEIHKIAVKKLYIEEEYIILEGKVNDKKTVVGKVRIEVQSKAENLGTMTLPSSKSPNLEVENKPKQTAVKVDKIYQEWIPRHKNPRHDIH